MDAMAVLIDEAPVPVATAVKLGNAEIEAAISVAVLSTVTGAPEATDSATVSTPLAYVDVNPEVPVGTVTLTSTAFPAAPARAVSAVMLITPLAPEPIASTALPTLLVE